MFVNKIWQRCLNRFVLQMHICFSRQMCYVWFIVRISATNNTSIICYNGELESRVTHKKQRGMLQRVKSPLLVKRVEYWWSIIHTDVYLHMSLAGYITKQPLFINVMGVFALISQRTPKFYSFSCATPPGTLVFHFSLRWEHRSRSATLSLSLRSPPSPPPPTPLAYPRLKNNLRY